MKAVALNYADRTLIEKQVPEPVLQDEKDVLFQVREVGICGTDRDLASFRLLFPSQKKDFLVLGHECMGEVLQTGPEVNSVRPGDFVVPIVRRPCSLPCRWCATARRDLCSTGNYTERGIIGAHGYFTELAVDTESDLVVIPPAIRNYAVLIEPLSVVEKAVGNALRLHPGDPRKALVLGAGAVGLLSAMALRARGLAVTLSSLEPPDSHRAALAFLAEAEYVTEPEGPFDIVIEAAGPAAAAHTALRVLAPAGVLVTLGVNQPVEIPMLQLVLKNQILAGSVNASPSDFLTAVEDLAAFPRAVLEQMIVREPWGSFRSTLTGPLRSAPKVVHVTE